MTLLTDKDQAIPVEVRRNGLRGILAGAGSGAMELRFMPANADVQAGDLLTTSGLDGIYLPGLPVAKVIGIERDNSMAFAHVACEPVAGVERNGLVLVLGRRIAPDRPEEDVRAPEPPTKGKQSRARTR